MNRLLLLTLLSTVALADSVTVSGTCQQNPCAVQITDQFGDNWGYAGADIQEQAAGVIGSVYTSLGLTSLYQQINPGADAQNPQLSFAVEIELPLVNGTYDVFVNSTGKSDDCGSCDPTLQIAGLSNGVDLGEGTTEYLGVQPLSSFTLSGFVSTVVEDSSDQLGFNVYWTDPPAGTVGDTAPEPGALWLTLTAGAIVGVLKSMLKLSTS